MKIQRHLLSKTGQVYDFMKERCQVNSRYEERQSPLGYSLRLNYKAGPLPAIRSIRPLGHSSPSGISCCAIVIRLPAR